MRSFIPALAIAAAAAFLAAFGCGTGSIGDGVPSPAGLLHTDPSGSGAGGGASSGVDPLGETTDGGLALTADGSLAVPPGCAFPVAESEHAARIATLGTQIDGLVTKFERDYPSSTAGAVGCPAAGTTASTDATGNWGSYAFAKLTRGTNATGTAQAQSAVSCLFTYQDSKPSSPTYGVFRFHVDDPPLASDNSTEFALQPVAWLLARGLLPAATVTKLSTQIRAGLDAIDGHDVCTNYTNICLLQQGIRLGIGAAFAASSDATLAADGKSRIAKAKTELAAWTASVKSGGVREYDSPTYGEVDLEALLLARAGAEKAADTSLVALVDGVSDFLWSDFSANVFTSRGTLAPPYSRTYDFAGGQGILSYGLWLEGVLATPWAALAPTPMMAAWLGTDDAGAYRPPASALCLSAQLSREVTSQWQESGTKSTYGRYAYLTADYSLGSATTDYPIGGNIDVDMTLGGSLVSTPSTPLLTMIPDWLDAPIASTTAGHFDKPTHLLLDPGLVQQRGAMLVLARVPAADPGYQQSNGDAVPLVNLTSNLVAPAMADAVLLDGVQIDPTKTATTSTRPILVAQNGTGVMAMAVIDASGLDCVTASGSITETGAAHGVIEPLAVPDEGPAVRVAMRHLDAPPADTSTLAPCFARLTLLMVARHCDGASCGKALYTDVAAAVKAATSTFDKTTGAWSVTVKAPTDDASPPTLHVARGTATAGNVTERTIDGVTPSFARFSVNGTTLSLSP